MTTDIIQLSANGEFVMLLIL